MMARLGDVCESASANLLQKDLEGSAGEYAVYGASGFIKNVDFFQRDEPYIAIIKDGAGVGRVMKLPGKTSVIGTMQYILPKANVNIDYLAYAMEYMNLGKYYTGATIPHIYFKDYKRENLNLPSLDRQREIAAVLDKISELSAKRKNQLDKLDELIKARFVEMFGDVTLNTKQWTCAAINEVCSAILGGGTPSKSHPEYFTGNIPWVSPKDMKTSIIDDSLDHITEVALANSTTKMVPKKSVLMVIRSGILKHTLPVAINSVPVAINQDMKAFVPGKQLTAEYLMYYLKLIEKEILGKVRSVTADNIDFKAFMSREITLPPLALQQQFASFAACVEKQKSAINRSLAKLETLKKSLMQEYFG